MPGACASEAWLARAEEAQLVELDQRRRPGGGQGRLSSFPSDERSTCASERRSTMTPERGAPTSSANGTPRPTAIFQSTPTVGLLLQVSICESAARLTPDDLGEVVEREAASLAPLPQVLGDAAGEFGRADVVTGSGEGAIGLARFHVILRDTRTVGWYPETIRKASRSEAHAQVATARDMRIKPNFAEWRAR